MALIGFLVLTGVGFRAFVNTAFFCAQNEGIRVEFVEIEAETGSESDQRRFVFIVAANEFETDDFFRLEFVLHQVPVHHATVRGNGVKVVFL